MSDDHEKRIRERAHRLWEEAGRPPDHALDHWLEAERQIEREATPSGGQADEGEAERTAARTANRKDKTATETGPAAKRARKASHSEDPAPQ